MDSGEILPSIYKRNLREEKYVENISAPASDPDRFLRKT